MTGSGLLWSCGLIIYLLIGSASSEDNATSPRQYQTTDVPYSPQWSAGTWGPWSSWSPCSKSCGRGVSTQTRRCLDDSKSLRHIRHRRMRNRRENGQCLGIYKRFHLCELRPCQVPTDLRTEACKAFDDKPFRGRFFKWEPHFAETDDCALNCRPQGHKFYVTLSSQVEDGTPCSADNLVTDRLCVAGQCKSVGCDGIIGSGLFADQCGVCGGDSSTCRIFSGYYTKPTMPIGYNLIAKIPAGSRSINVTELRNSKNYIALRTEDGEFIINGKWKMMPSGEYRAAGTVFVYSNEFSGNKGENIFAAGPTNKSVHLLEEYSIDENFTFLADTYISLVYQQYNPGVRYSYAVPLKLKVEDTRTSNNQSNLEVGQPPWHQNSVSSFKKPHQKRVHQQRDGKSHEKRSRKRRRNRAHKHRSSNVLNDVANDQSQSVTDHYRWRITGYTDCSRTCGGGTSQTMVACYKRDTFTVVNDSFCDISRKPPAHSITCKTQQCPSRWLEGPWSNCSVACGEGQQTRKVSCVLTTTSSQVTVDDAQCRGQDRPMSSQSCKSSNCSGGWHVEEWTKCSVECGKGMRKRKVTCDKDICNDPKPSEEEGCDMGHCESVWLSSPWLDTNCSKSCKPDEGLQTRKVVCIHGVRKTKDDFCDAESQPPSVRPCTSSEPCMGQWFISPWSKCSVQCGEGHRNRDVVCMNFAKGHWHSALSINCDRSTKPEVTEKCHGEACEDEWYATEWSQCSATCDGGSQTREVMCLSMELTTSQKCPEHLRPSSKQSCNTQPCPEHGQKDSGCGDKLNNCPLVVQARLCRYDYYRNICCHSCHTHQSKGGSVVKETNKPI